jgi:lupus La protein
LQESGPLVIEYKGVQLEVDPVTGKVLDDSKVPVAEKTGLKFSAPGNGENWKDLKADIMKHGLPTPFMAFPPGAKSGSVSKAEGDEITDAELETLNGAKITYGGEPVTFERLNGM